MNRALLLIVSVLFTTNCFAQFTIAPKINSNQLPTVAVLDSSTLVSNTLNNKFRDRARERAERMKLRNDRNFVKFDASLTVNQSKFQHWAKGGQNILNANAALFFNHKYSHNRFYVDYSFDSKYGMNMVDKRITKSIDYFTFNPTIGWLINRHWSYTISGTLRSQFANTYRYGTIKDNEGNEVETKTLTSAFMAPGLMNLSVGLTYRNKPNNENIRLQILPIGGEMKTVLHSWLAEHGNLLGKDFKKRSRNSFGSSIMLDLNYRFAKERIIWRFSGNVFTNYRTNTNIEITNDLSFRVGKYVTFNTFVRLLGDQIERQRPWDAEAANPGPKPVRQFFQTNYQYGIGLAYNFKNKEKKQ